MRGDDRASGVGGSGFAGGGAQGSEPIRVGVVGVGGVSEGAVLASSRGAGWSAEVISLSGEGGVGLGAGAFDVALVLVGPGRVGAAAMVIGELCGADPCLGVVACTGRVSVEEAVSLVRAGAWDVVRMSGGGEELVGRVPACAARSREARLERDRSEGLARMCRRLEEERRALAESGSIGALGLDEEVGGFGPGDVEGCDDPGDGVLFGGMPGPAVDGLDMELDVEALLRGSLEHLAGGMRPMNAAVFLPTSNGDYALGAYVNADLSAETRDVLLDAMADAVPGAVEGTEGLMVLRDAGAMEAAFGETGAWLEAMEVIAGGCVSGGETVAAVAFFRDRRAGFGAEEIEDLRRFRAVFSERLGRVVRVHNRAVPGLQWFGFDVGEGGEEEEDAGEGWRDAA